MARKDSTKTSKEPGRFANVWLATKMAVKHERINVLYFAIAFVLPFALGITVAMLFSNGNIFVMILWIISGVFTGLLALIIVLGRRVQKAAYEQMTGKAGAVGAVLKSGVSRSWAASETPVAISPRNQDAIYRAIGRAGVVLIAEGPRGRTTKMLDDERRKVSRILPNVPVNVLRVGPDADSVPLIKLNKAMKSFKKKLTRAEVSAVRNRLASLTANPMDMVPKGMDPRRMRAPRPR